MKTIRLAISIITISFLGIFMSCEEDFLEQFPVGAYSDNILATGDGVKQLLIGAYTELNGEFGMNTAPQGALFAVIHGGEAFKGSTAGDQPAMLEFSQYNVTTGNSYIEGFWENYYDAVYRCNQVLIVLEKVSEEDLSADERAQITAEARFLRGHYHFMLKRAFGNIPYIDETAEDIRVSNYEESGDYANAWPGIAADFEYAKDNLPATQSDLGRPNSWAAAAYYAKTLIYRANEGEYSSGYSEALTLLTNVINNGVTCSNEKYGLMANYHDNFNAATENNKESVFSVQQSAVDGTSGTGFYAAPNGDQEATWTGTQIGTGPGWGRGWGFYQPTPWYADHFRVDANGLPYLDMYDTNPTRLIDDYGLESAADFTEDDSPVDPRLDWTIGRRGIPFLDYGDMPGKAWIRDQAHGGPYITKKHYVYNDENGTYTSTEYNLRNAINVNIIRFADVLLMAAEVEARVGSLDNARSYVNQVRQRMVDNSSSPDHWVKESDGVTNAANYNIGTYPNGGANDPFQAQSSALDAILFERTLELGTEGHRFYDVVRFGKGEEIFNDFIAAEEERFDYLGGNSYEETDGFLPIPRDAIDKSLKEGEFTLKQNPGY